MRQSLSVRGFSQRYAHRSHLGWHEHKAAQIAHALSGVMRIQTKSGLWVVPPGRALWIPPRTRHAIDCLGDVEMRTIYLRGGDQGEKTTISVWQISPLMRELIVRFCERPHPAALCPMTSLLLKEIQGCQELQLDLPLPVGVKLKGICLKLLRENDADRSQVAAARLAGMSERSFVRHFQRETGMTFRHWRLQARLLLAVENMAIGMSASGAAFASGYQSTSAFSAAFARIFGASPRSYFAQKAWR